MRFQENIQQRLTGRHKKSFKFVGDVKDKIILDIGCSFGWFEKLAIENGCKEIIGIDTDEPGLLNAKNQIKDRRVKFSKGSALDLSILKRNYFNIVVMWEVLEHLPENIERKAFQEINRVLNPDAVRFIRKDIFEKVGGFDEELTGPEDWDFDKKVRLVGKVDVIDSCLEHNEGKFNLRNYVKKKVYYTKNLDTYIEKWGENDSEIKRQLGAYYRLIGVFVENGKWRRLMKRSELTSGMLFLRAIVGIFYVVSKVRR